MSIVIRGIDGIVFPDGSAQPTSAYWTTGDVKFTIKTVADPGWVILNDGTIGDASSTATCRANADCHDLFVLMWPNASFQIVGGSKGASAEADWAAHKQLYSPQVCGRAIAAAGAGSGLTVRPVGNYVGAETHTQSVPEIATHAHLGDNDYTGTPGSPYWGGSSGAQYNASTHPEGSSSPMNIMNPTTYLNMMIKL